MQEDSQLTGEGCSHCRHGGISAYCSSCGRKLKLQPKGRLACRAMEGSAEVAREAFGFADTESAVQRQQSQRREKGGNSHEGSSIKYTVTQGLAATTSAIERDFASPTEEQARIMGVESVVEGLQWDLSTKQLQVMAIARSRALRSRGRHWSSSLQQRTRGGAARLTSLAKQDVSSLLVQKSGARPRPAARGGKWRCKHHHGTPIGDHSALRKQRSGDIRHRPSGNDTGLLRHGYVASGLEGGERFPNKRETSEPPAALDKHGVQHRGQVTPEQTLALAKGGVRRGRVVFHRKGVMLSEESPRNVPPVQAFQVPGHHLLCTKRWTMRCYDGRQRLLSAALLAIIVETKANANTAATRECIGVRLDVLETEYIQHPPTETLSVKVDKEVRSTPPTDIASGTNTDSSIDYSRGGTAGRNVGQDFTIPKINLTENQTTSPMGPIWSDTTGDGSSKTWGAGVPPPTALEEQSRNKANEERQAVQRNIRTCEPSPESGINRAVSDDGVDAVGISHGLYRAGYVVFRENLTHAEVGALVGPEFCWRNPLEENISIRNLNSSWMACLGSLCGRMRDSSASREATVVDKTLHQLPTSLDDSLQQPEAELPTSAVSNDNLDTPADESEPNANTNGQCPSPTATGTASVADVTVPFPSARKTFGHGTSKHTQETNPSCRAQIEAPTVRIRNVREDAAEVVRLSLDRTLMRVGARVPWGPRYRGRFAKVLFTVCLGIGCCGLEFIGVSASPTGNHGVHGCWKCVATDRDLARILRPGVWSFAHSRLRDKSFNPERCTAQLQLEGELTYACTFLARKAFRLALTVPGGVTLLIAGVTQPAGREIPWPQDVEEDSKRVTASINLQKAWRGCAGRKHARWVQMDREGRKRLARLRADAQAEQERVRALEETENALNEDRGSRAQTKLAAVVRGRRVRRAASERRACPEIELARNKHARKYADAAFEPNSTGQVAASPSTSPISSAGSLLSTQHEALTEAKPEYLFYCDEGAEGVPFTTAPGETRLERTLVIDGTQVSLTAYVKEAKERDTGSPFEMDVEAVDMKTRRSSRLVLKEDDFEAIKRLTAVAAEGHAEVGGGSCGPGGDTSTLAERARIAFGAAVKSLTVFNSRKRDLFILSYKGRKVAAQH